MKTKKKLYKKKNTNKKNWDIFLALRADIFAEITILFW